MGLHAIELSSSVIGTLLSLQSEEISRTHLELGKLKEQQNKCRFVTFEDIDSLRNEFQAQLISEEPTAKGCEITFLKEQLAAAELSASELRTQLENEQIANESLRIAAVDRDRAHRETLDYSGEAVQSIQELRERCTHLNVQLEEERACNESLKSNSQLVGDLRKQLSELEKNFELHRSLFAKAHHDFESTSVSLAHALEEKTALESTIDQLTTEMNDQELFIGNLQQQLRTRDQMILELQASRAEVIDKAHYDDRIAALLSELSHEKETVADLKEQLLQAAFTQESKSVALGAKIPALERSDTPATDITFLECDSEQMEDAIAELSSLGDVSESATMPEDQKKQPVLDLSASQTPMPSQFATQLSDAQDSSEDATPTSSSCHITHKRFGSVPECSAIIKAKFHPLTKSPNGSNISKLL
ncbi:uncharacterized protein FIBRA_01021 [Fibroporia radiculosa]|uniref:Uncharacterized protein n=1 Tax=Fibroporia radiculosa TaxID=599839 RepID=J4G0R3_9APHY|nr:uncharacterized protein FIBRA_01021 [Fibroporia radiculosa]CCL99013.1 predicted protein [Fibroporia radiculosa]